MTREEAIQKGATALYMRRYKDPPPFSALAEHHQQDYSEQAAAVLNAVDWPADGLVRQPTTLGECSLSNVRSFHAGVHDVAIDCVNWRPLP